MYQGSLKKRERAKKYKTIYSLDYYKKQYKGYTI